MKSIHVSPSLATLTPLVFLLIPLPTMRPNYTIDFLAGTVLQSLPNQADEVANLLQICFPEFVGLSASATLEEGIGFHELKDTTWLLFRQTAGTENAVDDQYPLIGLITAVRYHDGLYLSNFCVSPECRNMGLGLDILEAAGQLAEKMGQHRLIGNARVSDRYIVDYYQSLGAQVIQTGMGSGSSTGRSKRREQSSAMGSVIRLVRDIPNNPAGVMSCFESLRVQRMRRRQGRRLGRIAFGVLVVTAATVGGALLTRRTAAGSQTRESTTAS